MRAYERLQKYVVVHTTSDEFSGTHPSTMRQFDLATLLVEELKSLGVSDARVDDKCYVYGSLPATEGYENAVRLGLIAHMDTAPDCSGEHVKPILHPNYDGKDLVLPSGRVLDVASFPHLPSLAGRTLITSDGTTLLGADDKAGIAEIMTMCETLIREQIPHGAISICFSPDEEIGHGAAYLDLAAFDADLAYTVDGSAPHEVEYETFNAASAKFIFTGLSVHPGDAKGKMINAMLVAMEAAASFPPDEVPSKTEGREGFYHLTGAHGNVSEAVLEYILRDHDAALFAKKKEKVREVAAAINEKYGAGTVRVEVKDQYRNMAEIIAKVPEVVEIANRAIEAVGLTPVSNPVRGGTDGAQLSFRGLPCPNLGTGGYAYHGYYEHAVAEEMDTCVQILLHIVEEFRKLPR